LLGVHSDTPQAFAAAIKRLSNVAKGKERLFAKER